MINDTLAITRAGPIALQLSGETKPDALVLCILTYRIGSRKLVTCKGVLDAFETPLRIRSTNLRIMPCSLKRILGIQLHFLGVSLSPL